MKTRTTHSPFFPTLVRYVQALRKDVSFTLSLKMLIGLVVFATGLFFLLGVAGHGWAHVYEAGSHGTQTWKEFLFGLLGSIDAEPDNVGTGSVLYSALVRLTGAIVIGGMITSLLCALAERFAEMKLRGLLVPVMADHFVVVGYGPMTDDLIRSLLAPDSQEDDLAYWVPQERVTGDAWTREARKRKVLLCTAGDVEKVREMLNAVLPKSISSRIVYAVGDMGMGGGRDEMCGRLRLEDARQIYILGDEAGKNRGNVENYAFAKNVADYLSEHPAKHSPGLPMPIFVCLGDETSMDVSRMSRWDFAETVSKNAVCIRPFGVAESWARRIWGAAIRDGTADPLDFAPLAPEGFVHLVIAGMTPVAEALLIEAVRVCHYPNGKPTKITVVESDETAAESFFARYPSLRGLPLDVEIEFWPVRLESDEVRELLRGAALDGNCLLTVAVCLASADAALSSALNLPEEVYWHQLPDKRRTIRGRYRKDGPRVWVRQDHRSGLVALSEATANPRYGNLRAFGMQEGAFTRRCFREFSAMYLNAVYDWPNEQDGGSWLDGCTAGAVAELVAAFRAKWKAQLASDNPYGVFEIDAHEKKDLLLAILAAGGDAEVRRFQESAFRKYIRLHPALRWANVYVQDSYGAVFRALGLRAVRADGENPGALAEANDRVFTAARVAACLQRGLDETEHNRWLADRALMGYRAPRPSSGEVRDDDFRYHFDMIPFRELPPGESGKDELSICCIPLFLALEGIRLERAGRKEKKA